MGTLPAGEASKIVRARPRGFKSIKHDYRVLAKETIKPFMLCSCYLTYKNIISTLSAILIPLYALTDIKYFPPC